MMDEIKRISVHMDPNGRLAAVVEGMDMLGNPCVHEYRTSTRHDGLWCWRDDRREWVQVLGTAQFYARDAASFRRRLRRLLSPVVA